MFTSRLINYDNMTPLMKEIINSKKNFSLSNIDKLLCLYDVNQTVNSVNALNIAVEVNNIPCIMKLLEKNALVNNNGINSIIIALKMKNFIVFEMLLSKASKINDEETLLIEIIKYSNVNHILLLLSHIKNVKRYVNMPDINNFTALMYAVTKAICLTYEMNVAVESSLGKAIAGRAAFVTFVLGSEGTIKQSADSANNLKKSGHFPKHLT